MTNDFLHNDAPFSFGKVELGVVDDATSTMPDVHNDVSDADSPDDMPSNDTPKRKLARDEVALEKKNIAVNTLEDLRIGRMSNQDYHIIRDALESMAEILEFNIAKRNERMNERTKAGAKTVGNRKHRGGRRG